MIIRKLHIKGFRNYRDTEIRFEEKNLIIGANDVGKTNMQYVDTNRDLHAFLKSGIYFNNFQR